MTGGLLNLTAVGNQNVFLTGNPKKTFFKTTYSQYTNFGKQKFRVDYEGSKTINLNEKTHYDFKIPRNADLLMDTFLAIRLPHIWSTISYNENCEKWIPYSFQWIEHIGTQMIDEVRFTVGGTTLQQVSGQYLTALVQREFSKTKSDIYDRMTGNVNELKNPSKFIEETRGIYPDNYGAYVTTPVSSDDWRRYGDHYPHVIRFDKSGNNEPQPVSEPSIRGRHLYIPMNIWYMLSSKLAFPLVALQYNELHIHITLRPVREWFTINNVSASTTTACKEDQRIQPNFADCNNTFNRFIHPTPQFKTVTVTPDVSNNSNNQKLTQRNNVLIKYADLNERLLGKQDYASSMMRLLTYNSFIFNYSVLDGSPASEATIEAGAETIKNGLLENGGDYSDVDISNFSTFETANYFVYFKNILYNSIMSITDPLDIIINNMEIENDDYLSILSEYESQLDDIEKKMNLLELFIFVYSDAVNIVYNDDIIIINGQRDNDEITDNAKLTIANAIYSNGQQLINIIMDLLNFTFELKNEYELDSIKNTIDTIEAILAEYIYQYNDASMELRPLKLAPVLQSTTGLDSENLQSLRNDLEEDITNNPDNKYIELAKEDLVWDDTRTVWDSDVHLMCTYVFLSDDERRSFAKHEQNYLFKSIHDYTFRGLHETNTVKLDALGMVSTYTFFFRRSDAYKRNEWSNYSNYEFNQVNPYTQGVITAPHFELRNDGTGVFDRFFYTPSFNEKYQKNIMQTFAILLDGKYRETEQIEGVYNYLDKYLQSVGDGPDGLYVYNFCLNSDPFTHQPSGALNMSKFKDINFEFTILRPPVNPSAQVLNICDPETGNVVGVQETKNSIFEYTYDFFVYEERFNQVIFSNGNCALLYAR